MKPGWAKTLEERVAERHRKATPDEVQAKRDSLANLIARSMDRPQFTGELSGVRATRDRMIAQEVAGGMSPESARRQVDKVVSNYDQAVRSGHEPPPLKKD